MSETDLSIYNRFICHHDIRPSRVVPTQPQLTQLNSYSVQIEWDRRYRINSESDNNRGDTCFSFTCSNMPFSSSPRNSTVLIPFEWHFFVVGCGLCVSSMCVWTTTTTTTEKNRKKDVFLLFFCCCCCCCNND